MLIRRETLQAVQPATTEHDTRYFLASIQVHPDGSCVATNGHVLIKASESAPMPAADFPIVPGLPEHLTEPTAPILLPAAVALRLCKAMPKRQSMPILNTVSISSNGDGSSYAAITDLEVPIVVKLTPDAGQNFPAYDRVIPGKRDTAPIILGVPVLETLIKSAKAIGATGIRFEIPTEPKHIDPTRGVITSAITATYHGSDVEAFAVAMPMVL